MSDFSRKLNRQALPELIPQVQILSTLVDNAVGWNISVTLVWLTRYFLALGLLGGELHQGDLFQLDIRTCTAEIVHKLYCNVSMML